MKTLSSTFIILFAIILKINAQIKFTSYNSANTSSTIAGNFIRFIEIDTNGDKWIGTNYGVSKFDDKKWKLYSNIDEIKAGSVYDMDIDKRGNKWFATKSALIMFDGNKWLSFGTLNGAQFSCIEIDSKGNIYLGTFGMAIYKFDGIEFIKIKDEELDSSAPFWHFKIDQLDNLWFISYLGGLKYYDGDKFHYITTSVSTSAVDSKNNLWYNKLSVNSLIPQMGAYSILRRNNDSSATSLNVIDKVILALAIDSLDNKWLGGEGTGLVKYDNEQWVTYTTLDGLVSNFITCITIDSDRNLWIGTKNGLSMFDGKKFTNYQSDGLENNNVLSLFVDKQDNKWIGTTTALSQFNNDVWKIELHDKEAITSIANDIQSNLYVTSAYGVYKYYESSWSKLGIPENNFPINHENVKIDQEGHLWFNPNPLSPSDNDEGLLEFDGNNWIQHSPETNNKILRDRFSDFTIDKNNNKWFISNEQILKFDGKLWESYELTFKGDYYDMFSSIASDYNGKIWISSKYLYTMDGSNFTPIPKIEYVRCIFFDKNNNSWIGTARDGLWKFDGATWVNYTVADGLPDNLIKDITQDSKGNIWLGTDYGIVKVEDNYLSVNKTNRNISDKVSLSPNPFKNIIHVENNKEFEHYSVVSSIGVVVKQDKLLSNDIDLTLLEGGLYFLTLNGKENSRTFKIIKD